MIITSIRLNFLITVILLFSTLLSFSQATSSPYSRYGLGEINNKTFGQGFAMGGTTIALQNDTIPMFFINTTNPASYAGVQMTTAELGMKYNRVRLESTDTKKNLNNASFGYVSIAFPFKKWWGGSFGLLPYSSVGYNLVDQQELANIGKVSFKYEGTGGLSQAYFGTGLKPFYGLPRMLQASSKYQRLLSWKHADNTLKSREEKYDDYLKAKHKMNTRKFLRSAAFGGNVSYLFGSVEHKRYSIFTGANTFSTETGTAIRVGDIYMDYGFQIGYTVDSVRTRNPLYNRDSARLDNRYDSVKKYNYRDLKENVQFLFGANFAAQKDIKAKIDSLSVNYFTSSQGFDITKDTVELVEGHKGTITLPLSFGVGFAFKKGYRWMVAADFAMQNWSAYRAFNTNNDLKNSMRASLGIQYVPDARAVGMKKYFRRIHYRIGGHYSQTALELKNTRLTELGVSAGLGFPVGGNYILRSFSMVNMSVEVGQHGTTANGLIREQYLKTTLSFTINDRWFQKPKID
ncbi:MAG: hypothetical protein K0Q95_246 [Bacteroidota bacterium]|jgi:hypothetical protein|nr:hypothetical protein [Bacteroidota bacterium]